MSLKSEICRGCGDKLRGDDPDPLRHLVWELPQPQPMVIEYQRQRLTCSCGGVTTCAAFPEGIPEHTPGPRLLAVTAVLRGFFRQSKSRTALALNTLFGVPCCPAWVVQQQQRATIALAAGDEEIKAAVPQALVVQCDATPFKQGTSKAWIGTFVAATFTYFTVRLTRAAAVPAEVLGQSFPGVIVTDRDTGYHFLNDRRQLCGHISNATSNTGSMPGPTVSALAND